jgi:CRISPR-associated endonuclease/helicase Cas3
MLGDETTVHLSASMCPAHRSRCITNIRGLLAEHCVCRVVSTQLVEAGVDLDFPVVYRSLAGVDSLVQAAGRANREGKLGVEGGLLRIFRAPTQPPPGLPRHAAESADTLFRATSLEGREVDPFAPETGRAFFRRYYEKIGDKDAGVTARRVEFRYREVAETYRFIRGGEITVAIPWDEEARGVLREIDRYGASRNRLRRIQPFTVSVFPNALRALFEAGAAIPLLGVEDDMGSGLFVLRRREFYDERFGLRVDDIGTPNPRDLVL